jgi:hypothetical protein
VPGYATGFRIDYSKPGDGHAIGYIIDVLEHVMAIPGEHKYHSHAARRLRIMRAAVSRTLTPPNRDKLIEETKQGKARAYVHALVRTGNFYAGDASELWVLRAIAARHMPGVDSRGFEVSLLAQDEKVLAPLMDAFAVYLLSNTEALSSQAAAWALPHLSAAKEDAIRLAYENRAALDGNPGDPRAEIIIQTALAYREAEVKLDEALRLLVARMEGFWTTEDTNRWGELTT